MQFFFSPILGSLSDRFGRRPVILLSNLGLGLDYIFMALAPTISWLFVGRVISGITSASLSTAYAYIADVTPQEKRAAGFGMVGAAFGVGFVLGPALGGLLGSVDPRLPFWVAAGLSLANACYGCWCCRNRCRANAAWRFSWRRANPVGSLVLLRSHPELLGLAGVNFLGNLAHAALPSTFVLYAELSLWLGRADRGLTLAGVGVASVIVQGGVDRPGGEADRRALRAARRAALRRRRLRHLRRGPHGDAVPDRRPRGGAVGPGRRRLARPDDAPRRRLRAGPAPGRQRQRARHHRS